MTADVLSTGKADSSAFSAGFGVADDGEAWGMGPSS
jgi:hypothetical protein